MKDCRVVFAVWLVLFCAPAARADDVLEIKKVVKAHYDAIVVGDPKAYDDYWADDRVEVTGRSETPNQYDIEMKGETLALYWELAAMKVEKPTFENVSVKVAKQEAELRLTVTFPRTEENFESYGARYRLRKTPAGWKIYFGRTWPIDSRLKDVVTTYTPTTLAKLDRAAAEALSERQALIDERGEKLHAATHRAATALLQAYRIREAHELSKELTAKGTPGFWRIRAQLALFAGDPEDSRLAYRKFHELDPNADIPAGVRKRIESEKE